MESLSVESVFDDFVGGFGGERVDGLITQPNPPKNADYLFREHNVIAELKCLTKDSFGPDYHRKMKELTDEWLRRRWIVVFGNVNLDLRKLPPVCQEQWLRVIEKPLRKTTVEAANKQIRDTKKSLDIPRAKGLLLLASDGNQSLQPYDVLYFINRTFQKRTAAGDSQFSSIHGVCYFSLNMQVNNQGMGFRPFFGAEDQEIRLTLPYGNSVTI